MHDLPLITTIAMAFTGAWVLGLITQKLRLSPIVGYLLAGVLIGPYTPGFKGDVHIAHQLAEVGVILLMFGVGLHFHLKDLLAVKWIAIPGAVVQSVAATVFGAVVFKFLGWDLTVGVVLGMAMAVASTVVLIRVLTDNNVLNTHAGHTAVGWLIVEDIFTVVVLVLLPALGEVSGAKAEGASSASAMAGISFGAVAWALGKAMLMLGILLAIVVFIGSRFVPWVMVQVARLRSRELFTLTVLVFSIAVAAGAYYAFGASMALGAFLAGMLVAQSPVSQQAAADALPLRDAFAVLFFVSVGMLLDPMGLIRDPWLIAAGLGIVLIVKPVAALAIVMLLGHSVRTGLTVAIGLAQIGEFSFILSEVAKKESLMPPEGHNVLVATAIISITLNPLLFRLVGPMEQSLKKHPRLWRLLNGRAERRLREGNAEVVEKLKSTTLAENERTAVVIGYGHVGRTVDRILRQANVRTVVIDMNVDTVAALNADSDPGRSSIYGDATSAEVLEQAGVANARYLIVTMASMGNPVPVVLQARQLNPDMHILVRSRYIADREVLKQAGVTVSIFEEAETAVALGEAVLADLGANRDQIERETAHIRNELMGKLAGPSA